MRSGSSTRRPDDARRARSDAQPRTAHASRRGFTLIELLVVIGVIVVLIGILVPTLSGARESARRTRCLVNLQQIGVGTQLYMDSESQGVLPIVRPFQGGVPGGGSDPTLLEILQDYVDSPIPRRSSPDEDFILGADSCYRCPSDRGGSDGPLWATAGVSYEYLPGLIMTGTELFFAVESPLVERTVTRAIELQAEGGRPLPMLEDADDWHTGRATGRPRNAVYFPGMSADWSRNYDTDLDDLFGSIGRILGR
ncbi:MAG: prepilin-type N-terminal cleavage/methylation domain-containing protein [Planctomycetota bacterium]